MIFWLFQAFLFPNPAPLHLEHLSDHPYGFAGMRGLAGVSELPLWFHTHFCFGFPPGASLVSSSRMAYRRVPESIGETWLFSWKGPSCSEATLWEGKGNIFLLKQTDTFWCRMESILLMFKEEYQASQTFCPPTWGAVSPWTPAPSPSSTFNLPPPPHTRLFLLWKHSNSVRWVETAGHPSSLRTQYSGVWRGLGRGFQGPESPRNCAQDVGCMCVFIW